MNSTRKKNSLRNHKGFSLVELIVVIVIMLVLSAVMVPNVLKWIGKSREANQSKNLKELPTSLRARWLKPNLKIIRML